MEILFETISCSWGVSLSAWVPTIRIGMLLPGLSTTDAICCIQWLKIIKENEKKRKRKGKKWILKSRVGLLVSHVIHNDVDRRGGHEKAVRAVEHGLASEIPYIAYDLFFLFT